MSDLNKKEKVYPRGTDAQIEQMLQDKNIAGATELLTGNAVHAALEQDFVAAENLRDRLLAVNPNALFEVIHVNEVIEREKSSAISPKYLIRWHELHNALEADAFNGLYHCQRVREYQPGDVLVQQGDLCPVLFFVNEGEVAVTYRQDRKEVFVKQINPGEIIGGAAFFDASVWTVSLVARTVVRARILDRQTFLKLQPQYPGMDIRLVDFCKRSDNIAELLKKVEGNRRMNTRYPVQLIIVNNLLSPNENVPPQQFKAILEDISLGGLSLSIRISQKEKSRLLLKRCIVSLIPGGLDEVKERGGEIVGVTLYDPMEKNYSIHVRFDLPMSEEELKSILEQVRK